MNMAGIGKVTGSALTLHNENSLSLANFNVDFTLLKVEAPPEFMDVGAAISPARKAEAEEGPLHQTARKLGALFEAILPPVPELLKAYGKRVSEILKSTQINPRASPRGGIFGDQIGADAASVWAAATSGGGAILVHLLACMLARMWTGPGEAIAVWDELVHKRKQEICSERQNGIQSLQGDASFLAGQQTISRSSLANWDASARAWLQSADQGKLREQKQLMLILDNINLPVNGDEHDIYTSVIGAWCAALKAMDNLIRGVPQQIQSGAALLGLSSWHLYPDMVILGGAVTDVMQRDPLFKDTAILTLGLQVKSESRSVSWSLPLARLKYYGQPVRTTRSVGHDNTRISMDEFAYIVLGCIFSGWNDFAPGPDEGCEWLLKLFPDGGNSFHKYEPQKLRNMPSWIRFLCQAADRLMKCTGIEREVAIRLESLGRRRPSLLCPIARQPAPLFGFSDLDTILPCLGSSDDRVALLRTVAADLNLQNDTYIIEYQRGTGDIEYATVRPIKSTKRTREGVAKNDAFDAGTHTRWLAVPIRGFRIQGIDAESRPCDCGLPCSDGCPCRLKAIRNKIREGDKSSASILGVSQPLATEINHPVSDGERTETSNHVAELVTASDGCTLACHPWRKDERKPCIDLYSLPLWKRRSQIYDEGERCYPVGYFPQRSSCLAFGVGDDFETLLDILGQSEPKVGSVIYGALDYFAGVPGKAAIYKIRLDRSSLMQSTRENIHNARSLRLTAHQMRGFGKLGMLNPGSMELYRASQYQDPYYISLDACATASRIYAALPGATIATTIVSQSLYNAKWAVIQLQQKYHRAIQATALARARDFACIAMFDSGLCNLDLSALTQVFAISSGSSIFVLNHLLADPWLQISDHLIRRVVGNIGRAGMSFLVAPPDPELLEPPKGDWMQINHRLFQGQMEDNFQQTSIHLSFTAYEMPLNIGTSDRHIIDRAASLVETMVSVHDRGKWIADLDVVNSAENPSLFRIPRFKSSPALIPSGLNGSGCNTPDNGLESSRDLKLSLGDLCACRRKLSFHEAFQNLAPGSDLASWTCIDNWDEFIDPPQKRLMIVRSHNNWLARFAFNALSLSQGYRVVVLPSEVCWNCCRQKLDHLSQDEGERIIIIS